MHQGEGVLHDARSCPVRVAFARQESDPIGVLGLLRNVQTLYSAGDHRGRRSEGSLRKSVCLVWLLHGCVHQPVKVTESLIVPPALVSSVCEKWSYPALPADSHWDGRASLLWAADGREVVGIDCSLTSLSAGLITIETRVDIRENSASALRAFLTANEIPVATKF